MVAVKMFQAPTGVSAALVTGSVETNAQVKQKHLVSPSLFLCPTSLYFSVPPPFLSSSPQSLLFYFSGHPLSQLYNFSVSSPSVPPLFLFCFSSLPPHQSSISLSLPPPILLPLSYLPPQILLPEHCFSKDTFCGFQMLMSVRTSFSVLVRSVSTVRDLTAAFLVSLDTNWSTDTAQVNTPRRIFFKHSSPDGPQDVLGSIQPLQTILYNISSRSPKTLKLFFSGQYTPLYLILLLGHCDRCPSPVDVSDITSFIY